MSFTEYVQTLWDALTGKAMAELHPETADREHVASLRSDVAPAYNAYSYLDALTDHERHVWVRKAVKTIADNFAPLPVLVLRDDKPVATHPLAQLLTNMNDAQSSVEVWQQWVVDMLLGGEEGWELVRSASGKYVEIYPRQPHTLLVLPDPTQARYFKVAQYRIEDGLGEPYGMPPDELVHFKFYNPRNRWRGISIISAVRSSIAIDTMAQAWARMFLKRGARPDYAVITPQGTTPTERKEIENDLLDRFGGAQGQGKPIVLEQGITDIKFLDFRPKDLEWVNQREMSRDEIGGMFGVPDILMGFGNDAYDTELKRTAAMGVLFALTVLPLANFRDTHLTEYFRKQNQLAPNERFFTDTSQVAALKSDMSQKIDQTTRLWQMGVPFNTAAQHVGLGLTVPGGQVGYLPLSVVPVADSGATANDSGKAVKLLDAPQTKATKAKNRAARYVAERRKIKRDLEPGFVRDLDVYFADLSKRASARLEASGKGATGNGNGAHAMVLTKAAPTAEKLVTAHDDTELEAVVKRWYVKLLNVSWDSWNTELGIDIAFDLTDPAVNAVLRQAGTRVRNINDTTRDALRDTLQYGEANGWTIQDFINGDPEAGVRGIKDLIAETYAGRHESIARTEFGWGQNTATAGRYDAAGVNKVVVFDNGLEDDDEPCQELNGSVQTLAWAQENPLEHPRCTRAFGAYFED